jgi:hypothetical protein
MFSLSYENGSIGLKYDKLDDERYFLQELGYIIKDIHWKCSAHTRTQITIDEYFKTTKPAIYLNLNMGDKKERYNLEFLESVVDRIVQRFKFLYKIQEVEYNDDRIGRKYDTNIDVNDYKFIMYLKD